MLKDYPYCDKIHRWFSLSYARYKVLPRIVLDDLPEDMQDKFLEVMQYIEDNYNNETWIEEYMVKARVNGKFVKDPLSDYRHGNIKQYRINPYEKD